MTAPVVQTRNASADTTTPFLAALPSGIVAGDVLIVVAVRDGTTAFSAVSGWTALAGTGNTGQSGARIEGWWRIATGSEGSTLALSASHAAMSWRISGAASGTPVESGGGATTNNTSTLVSPGNFAPSWGSADTLWIAVGGRDSTATVSAYPANCPNGRRTQSSTRQLVAAEATSTAASFDPDSFTMSAADDSRGFVIAVRGASSASIAGSCAASASAAAAAALGSASHTGSVAAAAAAAALALASGSVTHVATSAASSSAANGAAAASVARVASAAAASAASSAAASGSTSRVGASAAASASASASTSGSASHVGACAAVAQTSSSSAVGGTGLAGLCVAAAQAGTSAAAGSTSHVGSSSQTSQNAQSNCSGLVARAGACAATSASASASVSASASHVGACAAASAPSAAYAEGEARAPGPYAESCAAEAAPAEATASGWVVRGLECYVLPYPEPVVVYRNPRPKRAPWRWPNDDRRRRT